MTRRLRHVTLTTGHVRDSDLAEISDEALVICRELIARATAGEVAESVPIPGADGYHLTGRAAGRCLVLTVWHEAAHDPIATIGVAGHSRCGARLWRELHRWGQTPVVTDPERCPAEPWVAAVLDIGIVEHQDAVHWLGDFERCLGWAWISRSDHDA